MLDLLSQFLRQILRSEVSVASQHAQVFVPGDARHFHDIEAAFEQPAGGFMAQIMKAQILDTGPVHRADEGAKASTV